MLRTCVARLDVTENLRLCLVTCDFFITYHIECLDTSTKYILFIKLKTE